MIKFQAKTRNGYLVGVGLSEENWRHLRDDKAIRFNLKEIGLGSEVDVEILVFAGATDVELKGEMIKRGWIGPNTEERFDE